MGAFDFIRKPLNAIGDGIKKIPDEITKLSNTVTDILNKVRDIFSKVKTIFDCLTAFFDFIGEISKYVVRFVSWVFLHFFPWLGQYIECAFNKLTNLPNCFIWYTLDTLGFTLYLPFRFTFWLLDTVFNLDSAVQNFEHDCWVMLDSLDAYIHDDGDSSFGPGLGTGYHIIHFPDSVTTKCYKCTIKCLTPMPCVKNLTNAYLKLSNCNSADLPDGAKKCGKPVANFEKC